MGVPKDKRGWYSMIGQLGAPLGFIIAAALFSYLYSSMPVSEFLDWGWRYPFFVAFAINVVALFARLRMVVTPDYQKLFETRDLQPARIVDTLRELGYPVEAVTGPGGGDRLGAACRRQCLDQRDAAFGQAFEAVRLDRRAEAVAGHVPGHRAKAQAGQRLDLRREGAEAAAGAVQQHDQRAGAQGAVGGNARHAAMLRLPGRQQGRGPLAIMAGCPAARR